jgi:hypothetical protein
VSEIVLASNKGSGPLTSLQANGRIYFQNDAGLPGYNPNEEHALMQGGQAFALRDDLNIITTTGPAPYSSHPYVLLDSESTSGRAARKRVARETCRVCLITKSRDHSSTAYAPPLLGVRACWRVNCPGVECRSVSDGGDSAVATAGGVTTWT